MPKGMLDIQSLYPEEARKSMAQREQERMLQATQMASMRPRFAIGTGLLGRSADKHFGDVRSQLASATGNRGLLTADQNYQRSIQEYAKTGDEKAFEEALTRYNPARLPELAQSREQRRVTEREESMEDAKFKIEQQKTAIQMAQVINQGGQNKNVQSANTYDNGTVQLILRDGTVQVMDPTGNLVTGTDAERVLKEARREQLDQLAAQNVSGAVIDRHFERIDAGAEAAQAVPILRRTMDLLEGGVETGGWAARAFQLSQLFGVEEADAAELNNAMAEAVLQRIKPVFGAAPSAREVAWLEEISAGFSSSTEANLALISRGIQLAEERARIGMNSARSLGSAGAPDLNNIQGWLEFQIQPYTRQETTQQPESSTVEVNEGDVFTNPETGEKIQYKNGNWEPI